MNVTVGSTFEIANSETLAVLIGDETRVRRDDETDAHASMLVGKAELQPDKTRY